MEYSNFLMRKIVCHLYKKADGFVFQTEDAKKYFDGIIKCESKIIPNPINPKFIKEPYSKTRKKNIVTVGRLEEQKNHELLIDAYKEVVKDFPEYKLLIYGDGSKREKLESIIKDNKLEKNVILMGKKDDIENEIYDASLFVLSSDYEGMPNALMEAMALGLPSISTDCPCGGSKMLINNEENGILVKTGDKKDMAKAINRLIENKELCKKLSNNSYKIKDEYSIENIQEKWLSFIERIK